MGILQYFYVNSVSYCVCSDPWCQVKGNITVSALLKYSILHHPPQRVDLLNFMEWRTVSMKFTEFIYIFLSEFNYCAVNDDSKRCKWWNFQQIYRFLGTLMFNPQSELLKLISSDWEMDRYLYRCVHFYVLN